MGGCLEERAWGSARNGCVEKSIYEFFLSIIKKIIAVTLIALSPEFQKKLSNIPVDISGILLETNRIPVGFYKFQLS